MVRRCVLMSGIVFVLMASGALAAEGKAPRPGGFGGPGFGGFGGMQASGMSLLGIPEVQKELKLDDQQQEQVKELVAEVQKQMRASFEGMQDLSQEERMQRFAEVRKKNEAANKQTETKLGAILDAKQLERLSQLRLQREGAAAFNRPDVAKRLGLTEEQKNQMTKIREDALPQGGFGGFPGRDASPEEQREFFAKVQKQREKVQADLLAVLTAEQKDKWTEMKGKEFKFPQPQGPGGFGPGGFGAGGKAGERRRPPAKKTEE